MRIPPRVLLAIAALLALGTGATDALRSDEPDALTVIRASKVITVSGETFSPGTVAIENGKIRLVAADFDYPRGTRVIDARGSTVMPALVLARSRYGLSNYSRGGLRAASTAADEIVPSDLDLEELLAAGFASVAFIPNGSGIPGAASVYSIRGPKTVELIDRDGYLRVSMLNPASDRPALVSTMQKAEKAIETIKKARAEWEKKQAEAKKKAEEEAKKAQTGGQPKPGAPAAKTAAKPAEKPKPPAPFKEPPVDANLRPFMNMIEGKPSIPIVYELGKATDIHHLNAVLEDYPKIKGDIYLRMPFYVDYGLVTEEIAAHEKIIMLRPEIARQPYTVNAFSLSADLARAGAKIAFLPASDSRTNLRRLRRSAALLVRAGLTRKTALEALTLKPAKLLGIDSRVGSLERGKNADLIILDGDPLDGHSQVTRVMVGGEIVWTKD